MTADKKFVYCLALAALFAVGTYSKTAVKAIIENRFDDFGHYWLEASLVTEGYDVWEWDDTVEARNQELAAGQGILPTITPYHSFGFFLLMRPLVALPCHQAAAWWFFGGHLLFLGALWIILRKLHPGLQAGDILFLVFVFFSFWPLREQLCQMQPNFIVLFLVTMSLYLNKLKRFLLAGLVFGIALHVREYMAVVLIVFIIRKQWRVLAGAMAGFVALKLAAFFLFGWQREVSYWKYIVPFFGAHAHAGIFNESLSGFIRRVSWSSFGLAGSSILVLIAAGSLFIPGCRQAFMDKENGMGTLYLFLALAFILSPWIHESHYVVLYPVIAYAWVELSVRKNAALYVVFIAAYLLMGTGYSLARFTFFHSGLPALLTGGKVAGVVLLYLVTLSLSKQAYASQQS